MTSNVQYILCFYHFHFTIINQLKKVLIYILNIAIYLFISFYVKIFYFYSFVILYFAVNYLQAGLIFKFSN